MSPAEREILRLAGEGLSQRAIARRVGTSHTSVGRALKKYAAQQSSAPAPTIADRAALVIAEASPAPDAAPLEVDPNLPAIDVVRGLLAEARSQIDMANRLGDSALSQRQTRNAAALASVLARLEKVEAADSDVIRVTRADIDRTMVDLEARITAMLDRPLMCAKCSRELSIEWGQAPESGEG